MEVKWQALRACCNKASEVSFLKKESLNNGHAQGHEEPEDGNSHGEQMRLR